MRTGGNCADLVVSCARGPRYQDLSHWKLAVYDIFTSSYGPADLTSESAVVCLGLETTLVVGLHTLTRLRLHH